MLIYLFIASWFWFSGFLVFWLSLVACYKDECKFPLVSNCDRILGWLNAITLPNPTFKNPISTLFPPNTRG
ncbi:hypothetical protein F5Y11DRAFT_330774 [Daldinia sp. FL1419]|nr:hypothetical protein F5Y11DRAFT_330774 [Daldinia sp. FL1419]